MKPWTGNGAGTAKSRYRRPPPTPGTVFTGRNPFGAHTGFPASEVMSRIVNGPAPRIPLAIRANLPEYVGPAVQTALAKDRDRRFPDAESFLEALKGSEMQTEVFAARGPRRRKPGWLRYYVLPVAMAVVVLVVVLLVITCAGGAADVTETTGTSGAAAFTSLPGAMATDTTVTVTTGAPTTTTVLPSSTTLPPAPPITTRYEETAAGLAYPGAWTTGAKNASATGTHTNLAAVDVIGSLR
jgi:hypothetical protein